MKHSLKESLNNTAILPDQTLDLKNTELIFHVFVDLGVWGKDWRDELWIPQLQIELPPGGVNFACHAGTHCSRNYSFKKTGVEAQNLP